MIYAAIFLCVATPFLLLAGESISNRNRARRESK